MMNLCKKYVNLPETEERGLASTKAWGELPRMGAFVQLAKMCAAPPRGRTLIG